MFVLLIISGSMGWCGVASGFFIQYKFITPKTTKHSSYTYQKIFRALYGYTQNVTKANGKTYRYHRDGVLSSTAYIRPGKNCVIIPNSAFNPLTTFFKTGKNPSHFWQTKGDWKAVYYMGEKTLKEEDVLKALGDFLDRTFLSKIVGENQNIHMEISDVLVKLRSNVRVERPYIEALLAEGEKIISNQWFKECYLKSEKLNSFSNNFKSLKSI